MLDLVSEWCWYGGFERIWVSILEEGGVIVRFGWLLVVGEIGRGVQSRDERALPPVGGKGKKANEKNAGLRFRKNSHETLKSARIGAEGTC